MTLLELVAELIALRKKPTSQARFGQYPALLQALRAAIADCADPATLEQALARDSGYHLPAGERPKGYACTPANWTCSATRAPWASQIATSPSTWRR
jgi:hypothetical protein